jgi:hypothetical protein
MLGKCCIVGIADLIRPRVPARLCQQKSDRDHIQYGSLSRKHTHVQRLQPPRHYHLGPSLGSLEILSIRPVSSRTDLETPLPPSTPSRPHRSPGRRRSPSKPSRLYCHSPDPATWAGPIDCGRNHNHHNNTIRIHRGYNIIAISAKRTRG